MQTSGTIGSIAKALATFQGEVQNPKNTADNPYFNSKYAPLSDILNVARPLLAKNGLSISQFTSGKLDEITIETVLLHESGEWLRSDPLILPGEQSTKGGGKTLSVQGAGSAITYGRRYCLSAMLGLASEDDDDGNHATGNQDKPPSKPEGKPPTTPPEGTITESQAKRMFAIAGNPQIVQDILIAEGYKKSTDVKKTEYDRICKELEKKGDK